ncbi:two-component regulator propeller domain-containing protein [Bernardetia sp.]|uniref:ligand-binding sensor domain-containing protein n=1 Tax=Bernardetia sp. TaxID=1937974 RepID=UPI0025C43BE2|nr:two-component regulator propeller domain-containing protein [Bernardetia sp.]
MCVGISVYAQKVNKHAPFDPNKQLSQFLIDIWDSEKGLPSSSLLQLIQTKDGYLWISSYDGLLRFDGNSFDSYNKNTNDVFKTNNVNRLKESKDSTLWIGTQGSGLLSYKNGAFQSHGLESEYIEAVHITDNGDSIYVGTRGGGMFVYDVNKKKFTPIFTKELSSESIYDILEYPRGKFWLATLKQGVLTLEENRLRQVPSEIENVRISKLYQDEQKRVWVGTYSGILRYDNDTLVKQLPELSEDRIHDMKFDPAGNFWIVTRNNIYRRNVLTEKLELLTTETGEAFDDVRAICLDQEEDLWIPTARHGLCRLRDGKFINYTVREGLSYPAINSVGVYDTTEVLVGTSSGTIHRINPEENKVYDYPIKTNLNGQEVFNIRQDKTGTVWVVTYGGLLKKEHNGNEKLYTRKDGLPTDILRLTYEDLKGRFWIGTRGEGLVQYKKDEKTGKEVFEKIGLKRGFTPDFVMTIAEDNDGNLLVGTNNGGLAIENGSTFDLFTIDNGLPTNLIFNIHCDKQNVVWLATNAGLVRWKDKKAFVFDASSGLPNETIFDIVEDDKGYFWFSSNRGVLRVRKNELNALANGEKIRLNWTQYDKDDGMRSEQCKGATQSLLSPQGIIWIPTNNGVLHIDPDFLPINSRRPPVYVQKVLLDDDLFLEPVKVIVKPNQQRLIIDFTALSFRAPEKVKFKYKLEGFDKDWIVGKDNKREAVYTNLPNGTYNFQVIAANNDGVWNNEGANVTVVVQPHIYETPWFIGIVILLIGGSIWGVVTARTKQMQARAKELEEMVKLRTVELRSSNEELLTQQQVVDERNKIIEEQNRNIISSINYAKRIQVAMLPTSEKIKEILPQSFILFLPRDIVSGDFYWMEEQSDKVVVATADCTGHGVPGAFMSLIGNDMLNKVILDYSISQSNLILDVLNEEVSNILKQRETENRDGMDMNIWVWDKKNNSVEFAGAKNPLIYIKNGELHEIKADKVSIGGNYNEKKVVKYTRHTIKIDSPTVLYTFSDGFQDQFGGENNKKFMKKQLKNLLLKIHQLPMEKQYEILETTFQEWRGEYTQIDDVLIIGARLDKV